MYLQIQGRARDWVGNAVEDIRRRFQNVPDGPNGERPSHEARVLASLERLLSRRDSRIQFPPYNGFQGPQSPGNGGRAIRSEPEKSTRRDSMFLTG